MSDCPSIDPLVTPFVDGELPASAREPLVLHLRSCRSCRTRVDVEQAVRDLVHAQRAVLHRERAPALLRAKCASSVGSGSAVERGMGASLPDRRETSAWRRFAPLALAATLFLAVAGISLFRITQGSTRVLAAELAADHVKCFLLQNWIGTRQAAGAVEYALVSKFGWPVHLPERPDRAALELIGERTCLYGQGRIAHIMYRHEGRPVSLFMLPNDRRQDEALGALGHEAALWSVGEHTFVLIAREPRVDFERMALFVRSGLH